MEGKKFSSSRGVQILVRDFLSRYDPDALRYFLTIAGPETQDTDFTWAEFVRRNNDELVATWGNLVNRTLQSAYKNFGEVPAPGALTAEDETLLREVEAGFASVGSLIEAARFRSALQEAMRLAALGNQYVAEQAPWAKLEDDRERAGTILYVALRAIDSLKILLAPFLPFSAQRLHELLGYDDVIAGPLEFESVRRKTPSTWCSRATTRAGRPLGAVDAPPGAGAPGAGTALREARRRARRRRGARSHGSRDHGVTDSHAHLDACEEPAATLVERARQACVTRIVTIGTGIESSRAALEIAERHEGVFAALGIDPHQAGDVRGASRRRAPRAAGTSEGRRGRRDRASTRYGASRLRRSSVGYSTRSSRSRTSSSFPS